MKKQSIKHMVKYAFIFAFMVFTSCKQQANYEIATWQGFKKGVLTYTFDDNTPKQLPVAMPLFDEFDYKATFFIVTGWDNDWTLLSEASKNGHEITSHTVSHPVLCQLSNDSIDIELRESQNIIKNKIETAECLTIAYPYCVVAPSEMINKYYIGARICDNKIITPTPGNFRELSSIVVGSEGVMKNANDLNQQADSTIAANGWSVFLLHGVDDDGGYSAIGSDELRTHLNYISKIEHQIWITTFAEGIKYIKERNSTTVTDQNISQDSIKINLNNSLDSKIFNSKLTIRRNLPKHWRNATVYINKTPNTTQTETVNGQKHIIFEAVPNTDEVFLVRADK